MTGRRKRSASPSERRTKRFVFKSFAERVEAVDIDVFRRLDAVKFQPTGGSSFFHESLIQWRELNVAADFVELYVELLPLVQTLPELLLHKDTVIDRLLARLRPSAVLSLEPILSLIAILSRDLSEDFLQMIPQIFDGCCKLLQLGGDRDSAILEMIFTNVAYIFKYMLKFLSKDLIFVLKVTKCFRVYPQDYVRVFAAEAVSFLFRNAPLTQIIKGVRRVISETEQSSTETKVLGSSALFTFTVKGPSSGFHSRADEVLKLLFNPSVLGGVRDNQNGEVVLEILKQMLSNLVEDIHHDKIGLLWSCLLEEIPPVLLALENQSTWTDGQESQAKNLLILANHLLKQQKGLVTSDSRVLFDLGPRFLNLVPRLVGESHAGFLSHIFTFLLHSTKKQADTGIMMQEAWNIAFECTPTTRILPFIKELLKLELDTIRPFIIIILRALERGLDSHEASILPVLLTLLEKQASRHPENAKLAAAVNGSIEASLAKLKSGGSIDQTVEEAVLVWTALRCFPYLFTVDDEHSICLEYATAIDRLLYTDSDHRLSNREVWTALLGTSLLSHAEALTSQTPGVLRYLEFGLKHAQSVQVLEAVCHCAAASSRLNDNTATSSVELNHQSFLKDCKVLERNLGMPSKKLRLTTLKTLSLYEQTDLSGQILQDLTALEELPLDLEHSRRVVSLISQLKINIRAKPAAPLIGLVFHAMVGVLQNRLTSFWDPAIDCLATIFEVHKDAVRDEFILYLYSTQTRCSALDKAEINGPNEFWKSRLDDSQFTTPAGSVMISLLRVAQKVSSAILSKSEALVSLFLNFIDHKYGQENASSGKDWSLILKEWLQLLPQLKNIHVLTCGSALKQCLLDRFLIYNDPDVQKKAFDCLLNWKDVSLTTYKDHLYNLISVDKFREELTVWSVGRDTQQIADEHRAGLIPVLLRILYPKLSKRNAKLRTSAGNHTRANVLSFLSTLDVEELSTLLVLIFTPLEGAFSANVMDGKPAWRLAVERGETRDFIDFVDGGKVAELPYKRKIGFLYSVKQIIEVFDAEHIEPYLSALMGFVLRLLDSASLKNEADINVSVTRENEKQTKGFGYKDLRTLCLKVIALLLTNFQNVNFGSNYWDVLFHATEHSITLLTKENVHSDRPSALLSCFLAMSKDEEFTSLLLKNKLLVPNVFSLLLEERLSIPVHSTVLSFIENLLALGKEIMERSLVPHLQVLLQGLAKQLTRKQPTSKDQKSKSYLKQHLRILSTLSQFIDDSSRASEFLETMLPFLTTTKHVDPEIRIEVLKILLELSTLLDAASASKCIQAFVPMLSSMSCQEGRNLLCRCLAKIFHADASSSSVAEILVDMNSMTTNRIDESDYTRRQAAYDKLDQLFLAQINPCQASLILSQAVFDLETEDMRYTASSCLVSFVKAAAEGVLKEDVKSKTYTFLLSCIMNAMKSENTAIRREWLIIFRELVNRSEVSTFLEYRCLTNPDAEVDFFSNIIHVQVHRRIKAMARFRAACNNAQFSQRALSKVFVPLFLHSLFEVRANKDGNLVDATIETIGCIAAQLQWNPAVSLVMNFFRLLNTMGEHQKVLVRLICLVLEKTQVSWTESLNKSEKKPSSILEEKVLPQLDKLLLINESVNVPVALATVKVLQLMPEEVIVKNYPRICQTVTNLLKSRLQQTRDEARAAIVGMVEILGARFVQFTVKMLQASLKRGYEKHVLGYTINAILIRIVPQLPVGAIDYCIEDFIGIVQEEIFGEVSDEKEVEALARKMKERKQARSYDSLRLIAQVVTFEDTIGRLTNIGKQQRSSSSAIQDKTQLVLKNVAVGVQVNPSASDEQVLRFVHRLLEEFLDWNDQTTTTKAAAEDDSSRNLHILTEFGLNILYSRLKSNQLTPGDHPVLDTYVQLLQKCLSVKYDGVVSGAMRCLSFLLKLPLPAISLVGDKVVNAVLLRARASVNSETPLMQACMKLLTVLLRYCKSFDFSEAQVHELLQFNIFVDIENQGVQALSLLKAVIERKLVVPELYDLMERVQMLMVTSQSPAIRQRCSEILLQFLLDYPLGSKRLQRHFDFLLANLGYEHVSGREAALEMLHTVIVKFPDAVIEEQSESLFLTLITRLVNDKDRLELLLEAVIKVLMRRVGLQALDHMRSFLLSWMTGEKQGLWSPAAQVTGLLVEVMGNKFERHFNDFWPAALRILKRDSSDERLDDASPSWKETVNVLVLIEKLFQQLTDRLNSSCSEQTWSLIQEKLLHRHLSIRKVAARLFSYYFGSDLVQRPAKHNRSELGFKFLLLGAIFCEQLLSPIYDEELGNLAAENLTSVATFLFPISLKLEEVKDDRVMRAVSMLTGNKRGEGIGDYISKIMAKDGSSALSLIFRRLEMIPLEGAQAKTVLKWYPSAVTELRKQGSVEAYLPYVLRPLLKVERSTASAELKACAEGVRDEIRELVSPEKFAAAFNQVSQEVKRRKENRKRTQSIAALVDPENNARKKLKLGRKRAAQKKRKRSELRKR